MSQPTRIPFSSADLDHTTEGNQREIVHLALELGVSSGEALRILATEGATDAEAATAESSPRYDYAEI